MLQTKQTHDCLFFSPSLFENQYEQDTVLSAPRDANACSTSWSRETRAGQPYHLCPHSDVARVPPRPAAHASALLRCYLAAARRRRSQSKSSRFEQNRGGFASTCRVEIGLWMANGVLAGKFTNFTEACKRGPEFTVAVTVSNLMRLIEANHGERRSGGGEFGFMVQAKHGSTRCEGKLT